ncbi:transcriptional regulator [Treponema sp. TIM-1]|uniref:transcriptional regulator n=1 Tax=Treponema sp. TIM-1 TaxID=2898417 RepID=UPI003980C3AB
MKNMFTIQATEDFSKARGRAILSRIQHFMNTDKDKLLSFNDVKEILKPKNQTYKGMQTVPINLIVGSEGRYRDFNKYFLPKSDHLKSRWVRVDEAHIRSIVLPPIQLYEIGGVYFVRDGNHRVSVARSQGVEMIDAEVISLSSEIAIDPSMTTDDLRDLIIGLEKKAFYEKTEFGKYTNCYDLDFSMPGRYDVIYNHILVHKYYLNQGIPKEIPFSDALISWYNHVYEPIIKIIKDERLYLNFPGRTPGDLYVWIVKHWDFLKKKYGIYYSIPDAARDFSQKYGKNRVKFLQFMTALFHKLIYRSPS